MQNLLEYCSSFENEMLILKRRILYYKPLAKNALLSKMQRNLLVCLFNNITDKREIVFYLWQETDFAKKENSYAQLVYQLRANLSQAGMPRDLLLTLPRYGVCLNKKLMRPAPYDRQRISQLMNDLATLS